MNRNSARIIAIGAPLAAVAATGIAFAAWTANGGGSGSATALTAQPLSVVGSATTADLYPGFTAGKIYVSIANPNPYAVTVTSLSQAAGTVTVTGAGTGGCAGTLFSLANKTVSWAVPAGSTGTVFSVAGVTLDHAAGDGCQGATATIPVTVSGAQD